MQRLDALSRSVGAPMATGNVSSTLNGPMQLRSVRQVDKDEDLTTPAEGVAWSALPAKARLGDRLSQHMAALIECGDFGEGERLPAESDLASRFGVSRPVIREALSRLRIMGVITSRKGSGSYVQKRADRPAEMQSAIGFGPSTVWPRSASAMSFASASKATPPIMPPRTARPTCWSTMRDALDRMETAIAELGGMNADLEFHLARGARVGQ